MPAACTSSSSSGAQIDSGGGSDGSGCAPAPDAGDRCGSDDGTYVYFPALPPDAPTDAAVVDAALADGGTASDQFYTDEACRAFLDVESQGKVTTTTSSRTPTITAPTDGLVMDGNNWFTFTWSKGPGAMRGPMRRLLYLAVPSAYAHGSTTGDAYVVEFTQGCTEVLRVHLEDTTWKIDDRAWARLKALSGPITMTVIWAKYTQNAIATGTQPTASKPVTFTIAK